MSGLMVHLPATLPAFWHWLAMHWPTAPHGYRWQFGGPGGPTQARWVLTRGLRWHAAPRATWQLIKGTRP